MQTAHIPGNAEVPMERIGHPLRHITRGKFLLPQKLFAECILGLESELPYLDEKITVRAGWPDLAKQRAPSSKELCGCVNLICITRIHIRTCYPMTVARYQF